MQGQPASPLHANPHQSLSPQRVQPRHLLVAGAGYVGLATAIGFARQGYPVEVVEVDPRRVEALRGGTIPFADQSLSNAFAHQLEAGNLHIHLGYSDDFSDVEVAFVSTPTPLKDGDLDTSYVYSAAASLLETCTRDGLSLVVRSTVGPGTTRDLAMWVRGRRPDVEVLVNPEFLREGCSLVDFEQPSRVVIGGENATAMAALADLYAFADTDLLLVDSVTAELIKLGANSALAVRVSMANELAHLAHSLGASVDAVLAGIGADPRIGRSYLSPGIGFGGACLPKDLTALRTSARSNQVPTAIFDGAHQTNEIALNRLVAEANALRDRGLAPRITVIGVAFKSGSDSVRDSRAISLVKALVQEDFQITIYDPTAADNARAILGDCVAFAPSLNSALAASSIAIVIDPALWQGAAAQDDCELALIDNLGRRISAKERR